MELPEEERAKFRQEKIAEYKENIDLLRLAGELIVDHIVDFPYLREELSRRLEIHQTQIPNQFSPAGVCPM